MLLQWLRRLRLRRWSASCSSTTSQRTWSRSRSCCANRTASSGNDALRLLLKHDFALVLLDVEMPGMDGYEVAQLMRSTARTRLVPIIFVTAGDRSEQRTFRGYEAGAVDFLYKPVDAHTLESKVRVFVELYRKTHELAAVNASLERTSALLRDKVADLENVSHSLSHDLRAPLRSIRAFAQILGESLTGKLDDGEADALDRVIQGAGRMTAMIDELFDLLKLAAQDAPRAPVDLAAVFAATLEALHDDIARCNAGVTRDTLPALHTNRALVGQVLQNLIGNAIKFSGDRRPEVHVSAQRRTDGWEIAVRDNGIGIAPDDHDRVFRLFERVTREAAGTGVGLALCKRAVERLGGRIWIKSTPGAGSTFHFTIPDDAAASAKPGA
jgi:two-component system sensor histidine kinase/response regulator